MSKPDWEEAPEWATAMAMDEDGEWWWYQFEPTKGRTSWGNGGRSRMASAVQKDWTETMERRP